MLQSEQSCLVSRYGILKGYPRRWRTHNDEPNQSKVSQFIYYRKFGKGGKDAGSKFQLLQSPDANMAAHKLARDALILEDMCNG